MSRFVRSFVRQLVRGLVLAGLIGAVGNLAVAQDDEEGPDFRPGLSATYRSGAGPIVVRRDAALRFAWHQDVPDPRLPTGSFSAEWRGRLFTIERGTYRLHVFTDGEATIRLKDQVILQTKSPGEAWHAGLPVELEYGYHPLAISFRKQGDSARISLFWEGPRFQLEPLPERHLFHDPADAPDEQFAQGQRLFRAFRCDACHQAGHQPAMSGPALTHLAGNLSFDWLVNRLQQSNHPATSELGELARRMPAFGIPKHDSEAIAAYLLANSTATAEQQRQQLTHEAELLQAQQRQEQREREQRKKDKQPVETAESARPTNLSAVESGEWLFRTTGCLACHRVGDLGNVPLLTGGDLSLVAEKRPADFFVRWLADPAKSNPKHRMPVFSLAPSERTDLAAYLNTLRRDQLAQGGALRRDSQLLQERGATLLAQYRCQACHDLPKISSQQKIFARRLSSASNWQASCLNASDPEARRPRYLLTPQQTTALQAYLTQLPANQLADQQARAANKLSSGAMLLEEHNCIGCHARGAAEGIAPRLTGVVEADTRLATLLPILAPPALFDVGDKLHDEALAAAIAVKHPPRRPWLAVRMPRFELSPEEQQALVRHFVDSDRIPDRSPASPPAAAESALNLAGTRLVTADGFGCTSCHAIGNSTPHKVALNARGTDLSDLGQRIRQPWYDRWVRNPARIVPRMEMPSIVLPIRGVLADNLDSQLHAVWHVLNRPGFNPPLPNPVRVARTRNLPEEKEPAQVLTDVIELGKETLTRPLIIGLPNRHNLLFDLQSNRLLGWWLGDTARQRTRGKSWYWEPAGANLAPVEISPQSEVALLRAGSTAEAPELQGAWLTEFDRLEHQQGGVQFDYQLRFGGNGKSSPRRISLSQTFLPIWSTPGRPVGQPWTSGFRRQVQVHDLLPTETLQFQIWPARSVQVDASGKSMELKTSAGRCRVHLVTDGVKFVEHTERPTVLLDGSLGAPIRFELQYQTDLPVDQYHVVAPPVPPLSAMAMDIVPGFESIRLPLIDAEMPTGLAWREDGTLIICSLKGRVLLARDTDGDRVEDSISPFSDELAAPYGAVAHDGAIDVISKYALLRLHDDDRDGRAERTEVLASGWGYTPDYHDWAVGLVRDELGAYYVALPCQQDARSPAEAHLRGHLLKLVPFGSKGLKPLALSDAKGLKPITISKSQAYAIEDICAGLRFPMGLARNRFGDLFATDNQGNYNPFNELNHLQQGRRYGFINKLEARPDFKPPLTPPAIDIPHPWTRSVNGIGFLDTPPAIRTSLGRDLFGPFEGHLIGCEYDTRQLVRMSLEKVGNTYQGAIYPFTLPVDQSEEPLQGPICCQVSPTGDLYVGNIRDSGWGGSTNIGSIVKMRFTGQLPPGIAEVRARNDGFRIEFTAPVDAARAADRTNYSVTSYRRISTPAYGGPDQDRATLSVNRIELAADRRSVLIRLDQLREGFVHEIRLKNLAGNGQLFHPAEAHYTLRVQPE